MCLIKVINNFMLNGVICMWSFDWETTEHGQSYQTGQQLVLGIPPNAAKPGKPLGKGNAWQWRSDPTGG